MSSSPQQEIQRLQEQAKRLALSGNWGEEAVRLNSRILELDDRIADSYTRLGRCFSELGRWLAAEEMYLQVLQFDAKNSVARSALQRAQAERQKQEKDEAAQRQAEEFRHLLAEASFDELLAVGVSARRRGDLIRAFAALDAAVRKRPLDAYAWNALGAYYRRAGPVNAAREAYERAHNLSPSAVSLVGLAALSRDEGDLDRAKELYQQVLRDQPMSAFALNGLGGVYLDEGELSLAENCFSRAAGLSEGKADGLSGLQELHCRYVLAEDPTALERLERLLTSIGGLPASREGP